MPLVDQTGKATLPAVPEPTDSGTVTARSAGTAPAINLAFDSPTDGKAFSAAAVLRAEGYTGSLIGTGPVGLDRLAQGFRVGFDLLEVTEQELALLKPHHLLPFPHYYQPGQRQPAQLKKSA